MGNGDTEQLQARVAWLYYKEDRTQAEIADLLSLTRLRVNRILAECRASGLVRVRLSTRFESCVALERRLVREHGLADAVVIPTPLDAEQLNPLLGQATGDFLSHHLRRTGVGRIGVGWGATLREAIRSMDQLDLPNASVTAMMGGLTHGSELNTFEIASDLARRLRARCVYFAAPLYTDSTRSRDAILGQKVFADVLNRAQSVELALLSLGDMSSKSLLVRLGLPPDVPLHSLAASGAVGDILGQFIDTHGKPVRHEINTRVLGLALEYLRRIPTVILAAGGTHKAPVIAAALCGGLGHVLVSDEETVRKALAILEDKLA